MEHKTLEQLERVAEVRVDHTGKPALTRDQRLERWAELLERQPERRLNTLPGTEYRPWRMREAMRSADSPISIAFADPVLRAEGLKNDTFSEAKRFFELSDWQLHDIVCYCHFGATVTSGTAARYVRAAVTSGSQAGILGRAWDAITR